MKANVLLINPKRGMVAARECDENTWVILELVDQEMPEIGDVLEHPDFERMESQTYRNATQNKSLSVYVQAAVYTESAARKQCFLPPAKK